MKMRTVIALLSLGLTAAPGLSKAKTRDWQTGRLVGIEQSATESGPGIVLTGVNPPLVIHSESKAWVYVVETDNMTYGFSALSERPRILTINSQVKFALEQKGQVFLIDEKGKEFKASLVKQAAKQPAH